MLNRHLASRGLKLTANTTVIAFDVGNTVAYSVMRNNIISHAGYHHSPHAKFKNVTKWLCSFENFITNVLDTHAKGDVIVLIEGAALWSDSAKSVIAANSGDTFRLAYLVGCIWHIAIGYTDVEIIYPRDWKGNLSKDITSRRVELALDRQTRAVECEKLNVHVFDAIGMCLSANGTL